MLDSAHSKPDPYWPRGLSRAQAASYIGVGASLFDEMVKDGRMPALAGPRAALARQL